MTPEKNRREEVATETRPAYEPPRITVMDQKQVLEAFQITSAAVSWWG
ncbi:MAG: hypothetical protein AB7I33_08325 [Gemmatimonadales bacterium]